MDDMGPGVGVPGHGRRSLPRDGRSGLPRRVRVLVNRSYSAAYPGVLCQRAGLWPPCRGLLRRPSEEETRKPGTGKSPAWRAEDATLCRYITRPAIANERLTLNRAGQVVLTLKTPYRDGTTHIVMAPLEFMQRLAALIPRPRLHLIRFHGVLAPNARLRPEIIPTVRVNAHTPSADPREAPPAAAPVPMSWARLLKRVFEIDIEHCPHCGGTLKIIAAPSTGSGQASNIPPSSPRSSPTSACPPGHRPDPRPGPSTEPNWPDLPRISDPIRFSA
jgi:hypothetical protein